jgi:hypothetical protein
VDQAATEPGQGTLAMTLMQALKLTALIFAVTESLARLVLPPLYLWVTGGV